MPLKVKVGNYEGGFGEGIPEGFNEGPRILDMKLFWSSKVIDNERYTMEIEYDRKGVILAAVGPKEEIVTEEIEKLENEFPLELEEAPDSVKEIFQSRLEKY